MVALLQLIALCPITAHNVSYKLRIKSAKLLSALISLNDLQSRELRQTKYVANVMGMSLSVCKWHAYCWNTLFPVHIVIPVVRHWHMQICVLFVLRFCGDCYF